MRKEKKIKFIKNNYGKRLKKDLERKQIANVKEICIEYEKRFDRYMSEADHGVNDCNFSSYLNIYSGLAAYEILREQGMSEEEAINVYDYMCLTIRKLASFMYKTVDLFQGCFDIVKKSFMDDLRASDAESMNVEILKNDDKVLEYRINRCLYYDTCTKHGYPEFTKVFCTHDLYSFGVLKKHAKFIRYSTLGEGGECCHDAIVKVNK